MSYLSDVVGQAKQQTKLQIDGVKNEVRGGITGAIANAKNNASNAVRGTISNVARAGVGAVVGAAGQLISGNVDGAVKAITGAPGGLVDAVVNGAMGKALSNPMSLITGGSSSFSGAGGIQPGDALQGAQARADPLMSYCWYAMLPVISPPAQQSTFGAALGGSATNALLAVTPDTVQGALISGIGGAAVEMGVNSFMNQSASTELPWYFVESATLPMRQFESHEIFREGRDRKYPSKYNVDDLQLGVYLDSNNQALKYFKAWQDQILSPFNSGNAAENGGGFGRPTNYKKTIRVYLLSVARQELVQIEYVECWPTQLTGFDMNSGSSDRIIGQVTLSVGDVFITPLPVSSTAVAGVVQAPDTLPGLIQYATQGVTSQVFNAGTTLAKKAVNSLFS